jgi:hypothetical protein
MALERPAELAGKATLTPEEAPALEKRTLEVQNRLRRDGEGPGQPEEPAPGTDKSHISGL